MPVISRRIPEKQVFSFAYEEDWLLKSKFHRMLDPDLALYSGRQYAPMDKAMFGIFADSCPDRWGRLLMKRRKAITARRDKKYAIFFVPAFFYTK